MKVFFTASLSGKKKYQKNYDKIIDILRGQNNTVISLETQGYADLLGNERVEQLTPEETHYMYLQKGMDKANAVIIEASEERFRLGHEATLALHFNKPVLCLSASKDFSKQIKHPNFYAAKYTSLGELDSIVTKFTDSVKRKHLSVRFNGFMSPLQKNFLDWYANKTKKNSSEVIRQLIDDKIANTPEFEDDNSRFWTKS